MCQLVKDQTQDPGRATLDVMDAPRNFTAAVHQEEDWYVAQCLEVEDPRQHVAATPSGLV